MVGQVPVRLGLHELPLEGIKEKGGEKSLPLLFYSIIENN